MMLTLARQTRPLLMRKKLLKSARSRRVRRFICATFVFQYSEVALEWGLRCDATVSVVAVSTNCQDYN